MFKVQTITPIEILDSRGFPTVEVAITLAEGIISTASVPSGASTGIDEALELRDNDSKRYLGKGVQKAVDNIKNKIANKIEGKTFSTQAELDECLISIDGSPNKQNIGANAILAVSLAFAKACAHQKKMPLYEHISEIIEQPFIMPVPMMNILNGGAHADNQIDIQEFMIMPVGALDWPQALQIGVETYHHLKKFLKSKGHITAIGDEGGFAPNLSSNQEAIEVIMSAIHSTGLTPGKEVYLALDVAANELYHHKRYCLASENKEYTSDDFVDFYVDWVSQYPILSIEDPFQEKDIQGWKKMTARLGNRIQIVGDDIFVTNPDKLTSGIADEIANAVLIKLNQIGTLTETINTIRIAKKAGYQTIISHRSGETEETFIADLAIGTSTKQIKTGAPSRTDRVAKYNQLTRICKQRNIPYAGRSAFVKWIN